jgi:cytochrome b involved in lipid metabolism
MKSSSLATIIIVALVIVVFIVAKEQKLLAPTVTNQSTSTETVTSTSTTSSETGTLSNPRTSAKPVNSANLTNTSASPTASETTFTIAQVATHATASDCYTTINGSVYNVTPWIDQHPGGRMAIIGLCGKDGSEAFNGQHGGQRRPESELASFKIGTLVN